MITLGLPGPDEPLLERDGELKAVSQLLSNARGGRGRLLLLEAQAGIGKSTLIEHAAASARDAGFLVLRAVGREMEWAFGWGIARGLFEVWLHTLLPSRSGGVAERPCRPVAGVVRARRTDPDFARRGSQLRDLARAVLAGVEDRRGGPAAARGRRRALGGRAVRPLPDLPGRADPRAADRGAGRDAPRRRRRARAAARRFRGGDLRTRAAERSGAWASSSARRVPAADAELCRRCFELTGGNPLYVRELVSAIALTGGSEAADLDAGIERAARSLSRLVLRRLDSLSPAAQALARAVAVFESRVPLHLACELARLSPAEGLAAADELARDAIPRWRGSTRVGPSTPMPHGL